MLRVRKTLAAIAVAAGAMGLTTGCSSLYKAQETKPHEPITPTLSVLYAGYCKSGEYKARLLSPDENGRLPRTVINVPARVANRLEEKNKKEYPYLDIQNGLHFNDGTMTSSEIKSVPVYDKLFGENLKPVALVHAPLPDIDPNQFRRFSGAKVQLTANGINIKLPNGEKEEIVNKKWREIIEEHINKTCGKKHQELAATMREFGF